MYIRYFLNVVMLPWGGRGEGTICKHVLLGCGTPPTNLFASERFGVCIYNIHCDRYCATVPALAPSTISVPWKEGLLYMYFSQGWFTNEKYSRRSREVLTTHTHVHVCITYITVHLKITLVLRTLRNWHTNHCSIIIYMYTHKSG